MSASSPHVSAGSPARWPRLLSWFGSLAVFGLALWLLQRYVTHLAWHDVATAWSQLPREYDYLVQPFVPEVVSDGEWSLLYFAGEFSHAVIKRPAAGDYRVQGEYGGSAEPAQPDAAILAAADRALAAVAAIGHAGHAYVRVDGVVSGGRFLVMELELIEPFLHLAAHPAAAERLAQDVAARLSRAALTDAR